MSWKFILIVVVLIGGGIGYYVWNQVPETPKQETLGGYVHSLQADEQKAQAAVAATNLGNIQSAVNRYRTAKGTSPASLQDLVPEFIDHVPGGLQYDPATGTVSVAQ
jgi:hypothetical protein